MVAGAAIGVKRPFTTSTLYGPGACDSAWLPKGFSTTATGLLNVAVQFLFPETSIVVVGEFPEQSLPQPANVDPGRGLAVSCTLPVKGAVQVEPQFIPAGADTTVPVPVPGLVMVSMPPRENVAMQLSLELVILIEVLKAVPEQFPLQPVKLEPGSAEAVSRTGPLNGALWIRQPVPQLIPAGDEVTEPVPFPPFWTVSVLAGEKLATQFISEVSVTVVVVAVPLQSCPQPANVMPGSGFAVRVIAFPSFTNRAEQSAPQFIPFPGPDVTVPVALPCNCTFNAGA